MYTQRDLDRLTHHADRLDKLIHLLGDPVRVDRSRENLDDLARELHREIRLALRRDYDETEQRDWTRAEIAITQEVFYAAFAELSAGKVDRPQRMLNNARRARRVVTRALRDVEQRMSRPE